MKRIMSMSFACFSISFRNIPYMQLEETMFLSERNLISWLCSLLVRHLHKEQADHNSI